jgi:hypothetical protein
MEQSATPLRVLGRSANFKSELVPSLRRPPAITILQKRASFGAPEDPESDTRRRAGRFD